MPYPPTPDPYTIIKMDDAIYGTESTKYPMDILDYTTPAYGAAVRSRAILIAVRVSFILLHVGRLLNTVYRTNCISKRPMWISAWPVLMSVENF